MTCSCPPATTPKASTPSGSETPATDPGVQAAIDAYKAAADQAAATSLDVAKRVTMVDGVDNAVKKLSPQ